MRPDPLTAQIAAESRVPDLDRQIIAAELSGVLNWAVAGAVAWGRGGLQVPRSIRGEVETYREETDLLGQWITERTQRDPQMQIPVGGQFNHLLGAWHHRCQPRHDRHGVRTLHLAP